MAVRNPNEEKADSGDVAIIMLGLMIVAAMFYYAGRHYIGMVEYWASYGAAIIASKIHDLSGGRFYADAPDYVRYLSMVDVSGIEKEFMSGAVYAPIDGEYYDIVDRATERFLWILYAMTIPVLLALSKIVGSSAKTILYRNRWDGKIRNKPVEIYGDTFSRHLKPIKRTKKKVVSGGKQIERFMAYDYFPPETPDPDDYEDYILYSVFYSEHPLNLDEKRFAAMERCWRDILLDVANYSGEENIEESRFLEYYALLRFRYMDKQDGAILEPSEREVFANARNINEEGFPLKNVFTRKNSVKSVVEYMTRYRTDVKEEDFTDQFIDELAVFLEILNFRVDGATNGTMFDLGSSDGGLWFPTKEDLKIRVYGAKIERARAVGGNVETLEAMEREEIERIAAMGISSHDEFHRLLRQLTRYRPSKGRVGQPLFPRAYVMTPLKDIERVTVNVFDRRGLELPARIIWDKVIDGYVKSVEATIAALEEDLAAARAANDKASVETLTALISEERRKLQTSDSDTRMSKLSSLYDTHRFQETFLVAAWEYAMTLENMPTGRLSSIKKENLAFWYALCNLGGPFAYKAGTPIIVLKEVEKDRMERRKSLEAKFASGRLITDHVDGETVSQADLERI